MYQHEYRDWATGVHKHLYESNKTAFKIKFGEYLDNQRTSDPHGFIERLLNRVVASDKKVPCIVFDNADHFTIEFQERVFQYAHSLYRSVICLVIVPITDKTSWQLSRQGALQSFFTESFYLPTPSPQLVLLKRIEHIERKIAEEKPEKGRGYFFSRGIELTIENLKAFVNCLQQVFIASGDVAKWIGNLSNGDIRRCLKLTHSVVTSPHIQVHELMKVLVESSALPVNGEDAREAIVKGRYDIYPVGMHEFVQNIFALTTELDTSPLIGLRLLRMMEDARHQEPDGETRYVEVRDICEYFVAMGFTEQVIRMWLDTMLKCGLCLSYDPRIIAVDETDRIEISPSGRQHLHWGLSDWVYLFSMLVVTPIADKDVLAELKGLTESEHPNARCKAMQRFLRYCQLEDSRYCKSPNSQEYAGQRQLLESLNREAEENLAAPVPIEQSVRFGRSMGAVNNWNDEKKFGFVKRDDGSGEVFVHVSELSQGDSLTLGQRVAFDLAQTDRGPRAIDVVVISK